MKRWEISKAFNYFNYFERIQSASLSIVSADSYFDSELKKAIHLTVCLYLITSLILLLILRYFLRHSNLVINSEEDLPFQNVYIKNSWDHCKIWWFFDPVRIFHKKTYHLSTPFASEFCTLVHIYGYHRLFNKITSFICTKKINFLCI